VLVVEQRFSNKYLQMILSQIEIIQPDEYVSDSRVTINDNFLKLQDRIALIPVGPKGDTGSQGAQGIPGPIGMNGLVLWVNGPLFINPSATNELIMPATQNMTPTGATARLKTAPQGSSLQAKIQVNGIDYITFTFVPGNKVLSKPIYTGIAANSIITLAIVCVGSSVPGSDLSITLYV
jgi:hypothetical protein